MYNQTVTIVGAGLVGSLLAIFLAKRGFSVEILERRSDPRIANADRGRSINLAISARGLHALELVGLKEKALQQSIQMPGRMVHVLLDEPRFFPYGLSDNEAIYSISRRGLNEMLLTEAEATKKVSIRFDTKVSHFNPRTSMVEVVTLPSNNTHVREISPIIGTDGSASAIRQGISLATNQKVSEVPLDYGYKELTMPAVNGEFPMDPHALHIWPRATYMLIGLPNRDKSFTMTLFLPLKGEKSFEGLSSDQSTVQFFHDEFPDAFSRMPHVLSEFKHHPTGRMVTVKSPVWNYEGKGLLLGDAAHAIVPFFGQGMNAGFEDVVAFDSAVEAGGEDWERIFDDVFHQRKQNSDAIADLAAENFVEMRDKVADPRFQAERQIEKRLEKELPHLYMSRYRMVSFTRIPYHIALQAGQVENRLLASLFEQYASADAVDMNEAKRRVETELSPIIGEFVSSMAAR